jgi:hypothetical protein
VVAAEEFDATGALPSLLSPSLKKLFRGSLLLLLPLNLFLRLLDFRDLLLRDPVLLDFFNKILRGPLREFLREFKREFLREFPREFPREFAL